MKKYLPLIVIALAVLTGVYLFLKSSAGNVSATLKPSDDRHWLKLSVSGISSKAKSMEYELIYQLPDGRAQGVPGKVDLDGSSTFERDILLGSESAGKYTYDLGVDFGSLTLRFYSDNGKLFKEYEADWNINELTDNPEVI